MATYSFNHDSFGKTTNRAGAAGDNVRYNADLTKTQMEEFLSANERHLAEHGAHRSDAEIEAHLAELRQGRSPIENAARNTTDEITRTASGNAAYNAREEVTYAVRGHVIPPDPQAAAAWFDKQETADRKNARMSDRFIGALPRELTPEQCIEAVERFCREITKDRVPWHFALHLELDKKNEPDWNPHTHIIFRDRDIETGKRFLHTTAGPKERAQLDAKGIDYWTTRDFRVAWSEHMNHALERAGHDARIDHRTLKEQGIDRTPQIHIGPGSQNAARKGRELQSVDREISNRAIPYSLLDSGTRAEHNARIIEANKERAGAAAESAELRQLRETQMQARSAMYQDQKRDRDALRQAQAVELNRHQAWARELYAGARQKAFEQVKEQAAPKWQAVRSIADPDRQEQASAALKLEQKALYAKTSAAHVAAARVEKNAQWQAMQAGQLKERQDLRTMHSEETVALARQHAAERLVINEKTRQAHAQHQSNRIAARLGGRQGMPEQQKAANAVIRFRHRNALDRAHAKQIGQHNDHARQMRAEARKDASAHVKEHMAPQWQRVKAIPDNEQRTAAAKAVKLQQTRLYTSTSIEFVAKADVTIDNARQELLAKQVMERQGRRGSSAAGRDALGVAQSSARTAAAEQGNRRQIRERLNAQRQTHQLRAAAPERFRGQMNRAMHALSRVQDDPQNALRQAAQSGRRLTDAERANAPQDVKHRLAHEDRKSSARASDQAATPDSQRRRGKSRGGGGRGR